MYPFINKLKYSVTSTNQRFFWDYYGAFCEKNNESKFPYIDAFNKPTKFLKQFMEKSEKVIDDKNSIGIKPFKLSSIKKNRKQHIVSTYFIGVYVYENCEKLQTILDNKIDYIRNHFLSGISKKSRTDFYYFWFLTCFYHDLGYDVEDNGNTKSYLTRKQINETVEELFKNEQWDYPNNTFSANLVLNYLHYRDYKDHGIIGGIKYLIDRTAEYKQKVKEIGNGRNSFVDEKTDLVWSDEIVEKIHKPIARSIILHNIWFCKEGVDKKYEEKYNKHGLSPLIIKSPEVTTDHIFLYFLQLIDTIDPIKMAQKYDLSIEDIKISVKDNLITITSLNTDDMYWMDLKKNEKNMTIQIEIPPYANNLENETPNP